MHIGDAGALLDTYENATTRINTAITNLSPLLSQAYGLLETVPREEVHPRSRLSNVAADLREDHIDLGWRRDWITDTDTLHTGWNGEKTVYTPDDADGDGEFSLEDALKAAGLTSSQIAAAKRDINTGTSLQDAINTQHEQRADAWANFRRQEAQSWTTPTPEPTPLEQAELSLNEIRDILDTAKQDRGDGIGSETPDGIWSTNDLKAMIENEHGYYTQEQVEHAQTVLAMAESSEQAREHLGITESGGGWSFSDIGHLTLDVFGMVPVVGNAADGINAAWYAAEGEWLDAALSSIALIPGAGQAVTLAKPAIKAAAGGIVFRNLDEALAWAKRWLEEAGILRRGDNGTPEFLYRGDNTPHSPVGRTPDRVKSHVDPNTGDLVPAKVDGDAGVHHHVRGSEPTKSQSPYTSMTDDGAVADGYGDYTVRVNRTELEADIASGRVEGVEVLSPQQVQDALQTRIDAAQTRFDGNPTPKNDRALQRATQDLSNAKRDSEYLIRGTVPAEYVTVLS